MKLLSILVSILLSGLLVPSVPGSFSGVKAEKCTYSFRINPHDIQSRKEKCRKLLEMQERLSRIPMEWTRELDKEDSNRKQIYRVEYSNNCQLGREFFTGCDQNPDERTCPDGTAPYMRIIKYNEGPREGQVHSQSRFCPGEETPADGIAPEQFVQVIRISPEQFRRFPIKASRINSDPKQFSLRNGHTHLWAASETQTFGTVIDGTPVEVRAIPTHWNWSYGDGSSRSFTQPGNPMPEHSLHDKTSTSHSYTETGTFSVDLTTLYRGEFRVSDGTWQTIPGQAAVPSEAVPIDVWRTEKELIAGEGE
ncbi:hypothetical protein GcLGCM259_1730 [Glutamicibacter creatinolyticus]|uniref:PKD domain-containing protein n=1 Tax=Glutamicibacter creatinolyticus TaxID=162496 RepID=A0A5B7WWI3_9MICC|nr:hypothetical protein [Glutamicibacter creatinolyticus]QCY47453.1 hypothetical protein GcLGCM259_1730 [Glutamicibacter creatinolyticus]